MHKKQDMEVFFSSCVTLKMSKFNPGTCFRMMYHHPLHWFSRNGKPMLQSGRKEKPSLASFLTWIIKMSDTCSQDRSRPRHLGKTYFTVKHSWSFIIAQTVHRTKKINNTFINEYRDELTKVTFWARGHQQYSAVSNRLISSEISWR